MQIVSVCCALDCSFLQFSLVSERTMAASTQSSILNMPHECSSGCKAYRGWCVYIFRLFCFRLLLEHFQVEKIEFLSARIAELENASDAGDEPMQIDAIDDDVIILEAFAPATAAASDVAAAKKVRIKLLRRIFVSIFAHSGSSCRRP